MCWARAAGTAGHRGWILKHGHLYTTVPQSHVSCCSTHTTRNINNKLRGHNKSLFCSRFWNFASLFVFFMFLSLLVNLHSMILPLFARRGVSNNILLVLSPYLLVPSRDFFFCGRWWRNNKALPYCRKQKKKNNNNNGGNYRLMLRNLHFIPRYLHYSAPLESAIKGN